MKRGLKEKTGYDCAKLLIEVEESSPMKRGLKEAILTDVVFTTIKLKSLPR